MSALRTRSEEAALHAWEAEHDTEGTICETCRQPGDLDDMTVEDDRWECPTCTMKRRGIGRAAS